MSGAAGLIAPRPRGTVVVRMANGWVRLSPHMEANPQDIPAVFVAEMPSEQKKELGICLD